MKYEIGNRVKIREDLIADKMYGDNMFASGMIPWRGQIATIVLCTVDGYLLEHGGNWYWTDEMIEGLASESDDVKDDYYAKSAMQPLEVSQVLLTREQFAGALLFNIIKYRMRKKGQDESDVFKARQYAYWLELVRQGKTINPSVDIVPDEWEFKVV
jgi:hypothetical protein